MATLTADCGGGLTAIWDDTDEGPLTITYDGVGTGVMNDYLGEAIRPWSLFNTIDSLILDENIVRIGNYAFHGCSQMKGRLTIPKSVSSIGNYAFYGCTGFTGNLVISGNVLDIGNYAFYGCTGFTGDLIAGRATIGEYAFCNCTGFAGKLVLDTRVIEEQAFRNCPNFTEIWCLTRSGGPVYFYDGSFGLQWSSPDKTYTLYSDGWASDDVFTKQVRGYTSYFSPEHTYFNYITFPHIDKIKVSGNYKTAYKWWNKESGSWKYGRGKHKKEGVWT